MPPLLSDIMCGFVRHITCTPENIILLIYAGCSEIPVCTSQWETKMCILFICVQNAVDQPWLLLMLPQLLEMFKKKKKKASVLILLQARYM